MQMGVHTDASQQQLVKLSVCTSNDPVILLPEELAWVHTGIRRRLFSAAFLEIMEEVYTMNHHVAAKSN